MLAVAVPLAKLAASARATTGPTALIDRPRWVVSRAAARAYLGDYVLASHRGNLVSGELATGYDRQGFLRGSFALYQYDSGGQEISWVAVTYEYHLVGDVMTIDLWSPDDSTLLGHLVLHTSRRGALEGQLVVAGRSSSVVYRLAPRKATKVLSSAESASNFTVRGRKKTTAVAASNRWGIFDVVVQVGRQLSTS